MSARPSKPERDLPEGLELAAHVESADWEAVGSVSHGCRYMVDRHACGQPTVARLDRSRIGSSPRWWYYCGEHMFGRWVEDGQVMSWRVQEIEASEFGAPPSD